MLTAIIDHPVYDKCFFSTVFNQAFPQIPHRALTRIVLREEETVNEIAGKYEVSPGFLRDQGIVVNRTRVRRLMQLMGLEAIYPKPNLNKRLHARYTRPYLLRGMNSDQGSHFTNVDYLELLEKEGVKVSMDGNVST